MYIPATTPKQKVQRTRQEIKNNRKMNHKNNHNRIPLFYALFQRREKVICRTFQFGFF